MNSNGNQAFVQPQYSCEENGKTWYILNVPSGNAVQNAQQNVNANPEKAVQPLDPNQNGNTAKKTDSSRANPRIVRIEKRKGQPMTKRMRNENLVVGNSRQMFQNVDALADGRFYCRICERSYKTNTTMIAHLRGRHLRCLSECMQPGCNYIAKTQYESRKHQRIHEKQFAKELKQDPTPQHPCEHCEEDRKVDTVRSPVAIPGMGRSLDLSKKGRVVYTCLECSHSFHNAYQARRHREIHENAPKQCYYCGEVRRGDIDLREHYMKKHRYEGIRTFTCGGCEKEYTSVELFNEHIKTTPDGFPCRALKMRQDIYYGELPAGIVVDSVTQRRIDIYRYYHTLRDLRAKKLIVDFVQPPKIPRRRRAEPPIFDGCSLIQTEMGLKTVGEVMKTTSQFRSRPPRMSMSDTSSIASLEEEFFDPTEQVINAQYGYEAMEQNMLLEQQALMNQQVYQPQVMEWNNQNMAGYMNNNGLTKVPGMPEGAAVYYGNEQNGVAHQQFYQQFRSENPNEILTNVVQLPMGMVDTSSSSSSSSSLACQTPSNFDREPMMGFDSQYGSLPDDMRANGRSDEDFNFSMSPEASWFTNSVKDEIYEELNKLDFVLPASNNMPEDVDEEEDFDNLFKDI